MSDYRSLAANPAFLRHTGLPDPAGKTILELVPDAEPSVMARYERMAATGAPTRFQDYVAALDLWIHAEVFPLETPGRLAVLLSNVIARKQAEIALRESEASLQQRVAVLDVQLPDLDGIAVTRRAKRRAPKTCVVMLSMRADEPFVLEAPRQGTSGDVLKGSATADLIAAVHAAVAGRRLLSAPLAERIAETTARQANDAARPIDRYDLLTAREREVLRLAAQGLNNAEVGERLSISPRTAETHRANLLRKLGTQTQTDLVRYAIGRGIISMQR